jgi:hypothetical protein
MASRAEILDKLKKLGKSDVTCLVATFVSYEKATSSITVALSNGLKIPGVRLKASTDKKVDYYTIQVPRAKSTVLIGQIGDTAEAGEYYLIMCDEVEKTETKMDGIKTVMDKTGVVVTVNQSRFEIADNGKFGIKVSTFVFADLIKEMFDAVKGLNMLIIGTAGANPLTVTTAKPNPASVIELETVYQKMKSMFID